MKVVLALTCLLVLRAAAALSADCPAVDPAVPVKSYGLSDVQKGLDATNDFINLFNADMFESIGVKQLAGILNTMLPITSAIISLILGPGSSEVTQMQQEFAKVNDKLDKIELQLNEVMKLIDWSTTMVMYADLETTITTANARFNNYVNDPSEVMKKKFMESFGADPDAPLKLYHAIVDDTTVIAKNLATAAVTYTEGHRRHVMNFLLAVQRLIVRGAQLEIAYDRFLCGDAAGQATEQLWKGYMEKLVVRMQAVETQVKRNYLNQLSNDLSSQGTKHSGLGNADFAVRLRDFLTDKYDWRRWIVLAYNAVSGSDNHYFHYCNGRVLLRHGGKRNIVAVSAHPENSNFTPQKGDAALEAAQREGIPLTRTAEAWTKLIRKHIPGCLEASLVATVCWSCGFQSAWGGQRSYKKMAYINNGGGVSHRHTIVYG